MKLSEAALLTELRWSNFVAPVGSIWEHKNGGTYVIRGHSFSTERQVVEVAYSPIDEFGIAFTRPTSQWTLDRFTREHPADDKPVLCQVC